MIDPAPSQGIFFVMAMKSDWSTLGMAESLKFYGNQHYIVYGENKMYFLCTTIIHIFSPLLHSSKPSTISGFNF